jgi:hypothetical protein
VPRHFTGIRLLLVFVAINTVMFLILITSMTSAHPWLANVLPGQFAGGVNSSGYWVFFAFVLLVNAVTVLLAGFVLIAPAMIDGAVGDERRLARLMSDRGGIPADAREACLAVAREEASSARYQIAVGRGILFAGAIFFVLAFASVAYAVARAIPSGHLFFNAHGAVPNTYVSGTDIWRYTADQIAGALLIGIPDVYHWYFTELQNNVGAPLFTNFVLAFRTILSFTGLAILLSFFRGGRAAPAKPAEKKAEAVSS